MCRVSQRMRHVILLAVIVVAAGAALGVRYRYQVALQRLTSDIQAAVDLEAWALEHRDRELFMVQQDDALPDWYRQQRVRFWKYGDLCTSSGLASSAWAAPRLCLEDAGPGLQAKVTRVQLRGDVAWVKVIEGLPPMLRARFYRQTETGWKHTAPRAEFWADPVERRYGAVTIRVQPHDVAHVEPFVEQLARVVDEVSAALGYEGNHKLEVDFVAHNVSGRVRALEEGRLVLASPWVTGIPVEGTWAPGSLDTLDYWVAYWVVSQYVQPAGGTSSSAGSLSAGSLSAMQRALVDEYAVLYTRGDVTQSPILDQIVQRHGLDVLPQVLASLREPEPAAVFLARWLLVAPTNDEAYFHTLAGIGRKAIEYGREDSFALVLQVLTRISKNEWTD